jgi:hypothetical protein
MTANQVTVTAGNATATGSFSVRRGYGVNAHVISATAVKGGLTGITFVKLFNYTPGVPTSWPGPPASQNQPVPAGAQVLVCFMPPPADLLAGKLDAQLKTWLAQAPAGAWLCAWQEGNDPSNPIWQQPGITKPADVAAVHGYLRNCCAAHAPQVVYGQDFGSSPIYGAGQDCTAYTVPNLGFYSFDGYDRPAKNSAGVWVSKYSAAQVFAGLGQIKAKWPNARVAITETNTQRVTEDPASAGAWFTDVYAVACKYGCSVYATWWGPPSSANPDWQKIEFTPGAPYVSALNAIAEDCAA